MRFVFAIITLSTTALWAAPNTIRFQGRLTDAQGRPISGPSVNVQFSVYSAATGGSVLWQGPSGQTVETNDAGLFSTDIAVPTNIISNNEELYLQVHVNDGTGLKPLLPRQKLSSVPYAIHSVTASSAAAIGDNIVGTNNIKMGAVTDSKISDVSAIKISGQITDEQIGSVDAAKLTNMAGVIVAFGGATPPQGWLLCDGAAVSRTTYASLFAAIGSAFGAGNGSTTFNVPDFRGRFLRGVDGGTNRDPDVAVRIAMNTGGNSGAGVGSIQNDSTANSNVGVVTNRSGNHTHTQIGGNEATFGTTGAGPYNAMAQNSYSQTAGGGDHTHAITGWDAETRPLNAYVNYIIKY